jgi:Cu/Ag efflux protein CusF
MKKTLKKQLLMSFVALAFSVVFVSGGMAQQNPAATQPASVQAKMEKFNGVIEKVDQMNKEFVAQFHKETMTFSVGEHTKFMEVTKSLPFSDLKKGMWASVEYQKEGTKMVANLVNVSMPKTEAKPATSVQSKEMKKENPPEKTMEKK